MATINEIAQQANVSRTTVSRVLNNSGYVSETARNRVLKVIEETGYVPSESAKALRTKKSKVIGVILPKISTDTSSRLVRGLDDTFAKHGYQILLVNTNLSTEKEIASLKLLKGRHVDGIILSATNTHPDLVKELDELTLPNVIVGQPMDHLYNVLFDDAQAGYDLTDVLIEEGHQKIAFIGVSETDQAVGYLRKQGFFRRMEEAGLTIPEEWIQTGTFDIEAGYSGMKSIVESGQGLPDAVIAVTDRLAVGANEYLKEKRIHVPNDLVLAGMGASELSKYVIPSLITIDFPIEKAGSTAADLLISQLTGEEKQKKVIIQHRLLWKKAL